jgi:hypothetical protein
MAKINLDDYTIVTDRTFKVESDDTSCYINVELCHDFNMTVTGMPCDGDEQEYRSLDEAEDYAKMLLKAVEHARKLKANSDNE